jgi:tRNA threonylcarbamoyladenosine biosynthesis protein TsaE
MEWKARSVRELEQVARQLLQEAGERRVFLFSGELGSGKTTLIRALCRELGVQNEVTSPTFSLVNAYRAEGGWVYHMDLYRLEGEEELIEIGLEEYLFSGAYCFVEWPQLAAAVLPEGVVRVELRVLPDYSRKIVVL